MLFKPVEAVAAVAHDLTRPRHVAQLPRELQQPDLGLNHFLLRRHLRLRRSTGECDAPSCLSDQVAASSVWGSVVRDFALFGIRRSSEFGALRNSAPLG